MRLKLHWPTMASVFPIALVCVGVLVGLTWVGRNTAIGQKYVTKLTSNMGLT